MSEHSLSPAQARKLILLSQRLPPGAAKGGARDATLAAIEHLGYIQIDTISVIERAHHHTLWNRNPRYRPAQLDQLLLEGKVFEYWSHAAAYLPMRDYRFSLPRKRALASGAQRHWGSPDKPLMQAVLRRIREEGPLMARDFEDTGRKTTAWDRKPAKRALEQLWMQGDLMISRRDGFHKVYDLTERVLPAHVDTRIPTPEEHARFLIQTYLRAQGLGRAAEVAYLLKGMSKHIAGAMRNMHLAGELATVKVGGGSFFTLPSSLELLRKPLQRNKLKILSPFDNLVIQRKRLAELFGFDYVIECYLPASQRRYGYFVLPVLWQGRLVARLDCRADRGRALLEIRSLQLEPTLRQTEQFALALRGELSRFIAFCRCERLALHDVAPRAAAPALRQILAPLMQ